MERLLLKSVDAQNLQNAVETFFGLQLLFQNRHQHVNTDGNPNLGFHRVIAGAIKVFDAQVLLDPFEEQLHLPTALVEQGYGQGGEGEVVSQEYQALACLRVHIMDAPQFVRVMLDAGRVAQPDDWIAAHSG